MLLERFKPAALGALFGFAGAGAVMLTPPLASAKSSYESSYGFDRTWNAAVRMIRVDMSLPITEKDDANGYLLFEYKSPESGAKATPGSIELVRGREADAPVKVIVQLPQMPRYHEQVLVDALGAKMRQDYGDPPPRRKRQDPPLPHPAPDGGVDGGSDDNGSSNGGSGDRHN